MQITDMMREPLLQQSSTFTNQVLRMPFSDVGMGYMSNMNGNLQPPLMQSSSFGIPIFFKWLEMEHSKPQFLNFVLRRRKMMMLQSNNPRMVVRWPTTKTMLQSNYQRIVVRWSRTKTLLKYCDPTKVVRGIKKKKSGFLNWKT